jgi:hypothetical protein
MYETLIAQIRSTLAEVSLVKEIFAYPETEYTKYPAVVFYPADLANSYATTAENAKEYRFSLFVIVELKNISKQQVFESVLPKTVDAVIAQFDQDWNFGTVDGHRVRALLSTALWDTQQIQNGEVAFAQLTLVIKTLTSN